MTPPVRATLAGGRRRHFQHGPIDLVIEAFGAASETALAYEQAWRRFQTVLAELVAELPRLRLQHGPALEGPVGRRMARACTRHRRVLLTPVPPAADPPADAPRDKGS